MSQWPRTSFCGCVGKVYNFVAALGKGYTAPMAALGRRLTNTLLRTSLPDMMIVRIPGTLPPKSHLVISPYPADEKRRTHSSFLSFCLTASLFSFPLCFSLSCSQTTTLAHHAATVRFALPFIPLHFFYRTNSPFIPDS